MRSSATSTPLRRNSTRTTVPSPSDAVAVTSIVGFHGNVAPFAGAVSVTDGAAFGGGGGGGGGGGVPPSVTMRATDGTPAASTRKSM